MGLAILIMRVPPSAASGELVRGLAIGLFLAALAAAMFIVLQRESLSTVVRWMISPSADAAGQAGGNSAQLCRHLQLAAAPLSFARNSFASWLATALWAWIAVRLIGKPLSFPSILAIRPFFTASAAPPSSCRAQSAFRRPLMLCSARSSASPRRLRWLCPF